MGMIGSNPGVVGLKRAIPGAFWGVIVFDLLMEAVR